MAHQNVVTGGISESIAAALFFKAGYSVFEPLVPEDFDFVIYKKDSNNNVEYKRVQVKTMKIRNDKNGQLVIRGANSSRRVYSKEDVDLLVGVHLETSSAFLVENNEQTEYCAASFERAKEKWVHLTL